jgi:NADPH-dependent curcumin reductase CurA
MNDFGRVALCGATASYADYKNRKGIENYLNMVSRRIAIRGFTFSEFADRYSEAFDFYSQAIEDKKILVKEELFNGIEEYEKALKHLFSGKNIGKVLL